MLKLKNYMRVCIIGSGLSAFTLAKALVNQNITVDMITTSKLNNFNLTRTIGISKTNIDFINTRIVNIDKISWKINKIQIFSENFKKDNLIKFENNNKMLFSIVKNYDLLKLLQKNLIKNKLFKIKKINKILDIVNNYSLVINTDNSGQITKKFFSKKIIKKYNSNAYVTAIKHENLKNNTAVQIFTAKGPLAFLPISKNETSIVFSIQNSKSLNEKELSNLIHSYNFKYKIKSIKKSKLFKLKSLNLRNYYNKNILAFGDIIHKIHPLAGQGFNMTIRDMIILLEIINKKQDLGLPIDTSVCHEFEKTIRHKNLIFSSGIDLIYEFFNFERKIKNSFLSKSLHSIVKNPTLNKTFVKIADQGFPF